MRIKKIAQSIGVLGKVLNAQSSSNQDTYSCDYLNNQVDITEYELNLSYTHSSNSYQAFKKGKVATITTDQIIIQSMTMNTLNLIGTLPNELMPSKRVRTTVTISDGGGNIIGYGSLRLDTNGNINLIPNVTRGTVCSIVFSTTYLTD